MFDDFLGNIYQVIIDLDEGGGRCVSDVEGLGVAVAEVPPTIGDAGKGVRQLTQACRALGFSD